MSSQPQASEEDADGSHHRRVLYGHLRTAWEAVARAFEFVENSGYRDPKLMEIAALLSAQLATLGDPAADEQIPQVPLEEMSMETKKYNNFDEMLRATLSPETYDNFKQTSREVSASQLADLAAIEELREEHRFVKSVMYPWTTSEHLR